MVRQRFSTGENGPPEIDGFFDASPGELLQSAVVEYFDPAAPRIKLNKPLLVEIGQDTEDGFSPEAYHAGDILPG